MRAMTGRRSGAEVSTTAGGRKKGLQALLAGEIVAEIETLVGRNEAAADWDLEAIEMAARREALHLAAQAVAQRLNADTSDDHGLTTACPHCQQPARYIDRRVKTFTSALGPLELRRAHYHCQPCGTGFCPRAPLLQAQRPLRGLLGSPRTTQTRRLTQLTSQPLSCTRGAGGVAPRAEAPHNS